MTELRGTFYPSLQRYDSAVSIRKALERNQITKDDAAYIQEYVHELQASRHVSLTRVNKVTSLLVGYRRFLDIPYQVATMADVYNSIEAMKKTGGKNGNPYKQNTIHDYMRITKTFYLWMIENEYSKLPEKKIRKIKVVGVDYITKNPENMLSLEEAKAIIDSGETPRDRAFLGLLYESGCRVSELATAQWKDVILDKYGAQFYINDKKTKKQRYTRISIFAGYLVTYKKDVGEVPGNTPVFQTKDGYPFSYATTRKILKKAVARSGVDKKITPHLFRHSRITHMISGNYQESIIKKTMWGNVNTEMFRTYVHLSESDIDNELLMKTGVKLKEGNELDLLKPVPCHYCHFGNNPGSEYCNQCGRPLTKVVQDRMQIMKDSVRDHPELLIELLEELKVKRSDNQDPP
jgi:integrase